MQSTANIVLYGGGALAVEAATYLVDCGLGARVSDVVDAKGGRQGDLQDILGRAPHFCETIDEVEGLASKTVAICVGDPGIRWKLRKEVTGRCASLQSIVHPSAYIASSAHIGAGVVIAPFAFVGPFASVGDNVVLNVRATIGHDVQVGASSVISPHVDMNGHSSCGDAVLIGAGAIFSPGARLGHFSKIAAGSILKAVVGDGHLVHGNPASGRQMFRLPPEY